MSVIDSLSAGYRLLGRRVELLLIPVLLDLAIWLLPRLSLGTLFAEVADFYGTMAATEGMPAEFADMAVQVGPLLVDYGSSTNLLRMLANQTFMHMPSLMRVEGPLPGQSVIQMGSWLAVIATVLALGVLALLIGVTYLSQLAQRLPIGHGAKPTSPGSFGANVLRSWLRTIGFLLLLGALLGVAYLAVNLLAVPVVLFAPALVTLMAFGLVVLTFFVVFFCYFVTAGIVLDDLSIRQGIAHSIQLVRSNFGATLLFVLLTNVITFGFSIILAPVGQMAPFGTLAAIAINAYIGTGLAMALLVFYRTRWLSLVGEPIQTVARPANEADKPVDESESMF